MQGIAGAIYRDMFQVSHLVPQMLDMMKHRGKQPRDILSYKHFEIGICGGKIGSNPTGHIHAALDGTLYNLEDLRQLLEIKTEASPSQMIAQAYEKWGPSFVEKIEGDFAIAILHQQENRLLLFRDRIGKKPLYWYQDPNYFFFGSELKAILATGLVPQTPDSEALASYLFFGYLPRDLSPIKSLNKLLPGYYIQIESNRSLVVNNYWSYSSYFVGNKTKHYGNIPDQIDILLQDAVTERLPKQSPYGCFLSGGMGSASIAYYLTTLSKKKHLPAYTVGYEGQTEEDVNVTKEITQLLKLNQQIDYISPESFLTPLAKIIWYLDEPLADPFITQSWRLAELAAPHVKTVFSGMGCDELFGGHARYQMQSSPSSPFYELRNYLPALNFILLPILQFLYRSAAYPLLKKSKTNPWQFAFMRQNCVFDEKKIREVSPKLFKYFDQDVFLHKFSNIDRITSTPLSFLYFDVKTRLADCYILQLERVTAAHSLDWETPFLDRRLIEFLAGLSDPERLAGQGATPYLKDLFKGIFPNHFINRVKKPRPQLLSSWASIPEIQDIFKLLLKSTLIDTGYISERWLQQALQSPENVQQNFRYLWSLLVLEVWFRIFINGSLPTSVPNISLKNLLLET